MLLCLPFGLVETQKGGDFVSFAMFMATVGITVCLPWWGIWRELSIRECKIRARDRLLGGKGWAALEQVNADLYHASFRRDRHEPAYLREDSHE
jgi:hypothetical protein